MNDKHRGILRVPILPWGMVNAFIIYSEEGCVLVDAGLPETGPKFEIALASIGRTLGDVRLIVVTHGHVDHAGAGAWLREACGAPLLAHEDERRFLEGEEMLLCPTRPFGRLMLKSGAPRAPYERFTPDILLEGSTPVDLGKYGVNGRIVPTPGHTPGSLSVTCEDGSALVGDLVASGILLGGIALWGRPQRPPFEERPDLVADQLEKLLAGGSERFFLGHGGPLAADKVRQHAERLRNVEVPIAAE